MLFINVFLVIYNEFFVQNSITNDKVNGPIQN